MSYAWHVVTVCVLQTGLQAIRISVVSISLIKGGVVMNKSKLMAALLCGFCGWGTGVANADSYINLASLVSDFSAANAGLETAVPNIKNYDANLDGYPESYGFRFDVYATGTNNLLYSTAWRYFDRPAIPAGCIGQQQVWNYEPKTLRRSGTTRIHWALVHYLGCWDNVNQKFVELENSTIYSADVSSAAGTTWVYKLPGYRMAGFDGIDTDGDGVNDTLMVTHDYDVTTGIEGGNVYMVTLNPATGAILSYATYPVER